MFGGNIPEVMLCSLLGGAQFQFVPLLMMFDTTLIKVVSARLLHCKVTFFFGISILWGSTLKLC